MNACMCSTNKLFPICEYVIFLLDFQSSSGPIFPAPAPASVMRYVYCSSLHRLSVLEMVVVAAAAAGGCIADLI